MPPVVPYLAGLNASQKKAVLHDHGPLLVLAGAGSGKTRVLTMRIARLVKEKVCRPSQVLAVTFTNKAAREMRERLAKLLSPQAAQQMTVSTFHSFGARVLREHGEVMGVKRNYSILNEHERLALLKSLVRFNTAAQQAQKHLVVGARISRLKNDGRGPNACEDDAGLGLKLPRVYREYESTLHRRQCVDFDDLLLLPLRLFESHPDILAEYQKRFEFVCVDEYQDTNTVQMKLAQMLAAPQDNIMVVGDDDQSIYAWRGANSRNVVTFSSTYRGCTSIVLDTNYRSTRQILDAAMAVVANNRVRTPKKVRAAAGEGEPIEHYRGEDEVAEAQWVAQSIKQRVGQQRKRFADYALLFRTNAMMRRFEEELRNASVPYRVVGAMSFFERKEVKDIVAYMRFLANPDDELSMGRVIKVPDTGIGKETMKRLEELAARRRISVYRALEHAEDADGIQGLQLDKCRTFRDWCRTHMKLVHEGKPASAVRGALEARGYREALKKACTEDDEREERLANVDELLHGLDIYQKKNRQGSLAGYLQEVALQASDDSEDEGKQSGGVTLMTVHKSKGLEFPVVYLVGLDDSVFPSPRTVEEGNIDEERRLFYVAMTRAKRRLVLTWPHTKVWYNRDTEVTPCRFVREIPEEFMDGPLGEKQAAERKEFLQDFFQQVRSQYGEAPEKPAKAKPDAPRRKMPLSSSALGL